MLNGIDALSLDLYTVVLQKAGVQPDNPKWATVIVQLVRELMMGI